MKNIFYELSLNQLRWTYRRLYWGIPKSFLVLEIGSGGNPCARSDVLVDYSFGEYEGARTLVADRPTFISAGEVLPFKDNCFDFSISFHTLEHSKSPSKFLDEVQRVSKNGYIETPNIVHEMLFPYKFHQSFVWVEREMLKIRMKKYWDETLMETDGHKSLSKFMSTDEFIEFYRKNPRIFNNQFYWNGQIDFEIFGENEFVGWNDTDIYTEYSHHMKGFSIKAILRKALPSFIRFILGYSRKQIDIPSLLRCVECQGCEFIEVFDSGHEGYQCVLCGHRLTKQKNIIL